MSTGMGCFGETQALMHNMWDRFDDTCAHDKLRSVGNASPEIHDRRKTTKTYEQRLNRTRERNRNAQRRYRERQKVCSALPDTTLPRMHCTGRTPCTKATTILHVGAGAAVSTSSLTRPHGRELAASSSHLHSVVEANAHDAHVSHKPFITGILAK